MVRSGREGGHQKFKEQNTWPLYFQVQRSPVRANRSNKSKHKTESKITTSSLETPDRAVFPPGKTSVGQDRC